MWRSCRLSIPAAKLPLRFKFVANGHRHSPNTRPLIWDSSSRVVHAVPEDGCADAGRPLLRLLLGAAACGC